MKVEITKAPHLNRWYYQLVGENFEVKEYEKDNNFWQVVDQPEPHITRLIRKDECEIIEQ